MGSSEYRTIEAEIVVAVEWYWDQPEDDRPNIKALSEHFKVPYRRLLNRINGSPSKSSRAAAGRALGDAEELALRMYIIRMDELCMPVTREQILSTAQSILRTTRESHVNIHVLGEHWVPRFLARQPDLHIRKTQTLAFDRKNAHCEHNITIWFSKLEDVKKKYGIADEDFYNMDETGFQVGMDGSRWIVTREPTRKVYVATSNDRTLVSSIETICANGDILPPMLILPGKQIMRGWIADSLEDETLLATSESGFSNDQLGLAYIKHFVRQTRASRTGKWILLMIDNHGSHCTREVLSYAEANNVILFSFPPHATHFMQPLDVVCFQPLKHYHRQAVAAATRTGCDHFGKADFLHALHDIRKQAFKSKTIKSAFRKTGLVPFNPQVNTLFEQSKI